MRLEWWGHTRQAKGMQVVDESCLFNGTKAGTLLLVESQGEYDLADALQFIYGGEVSIVIFNDNTEDIWPYLDVFSRVYTSWDPFDRNRI